MKSPCASVRESAAHGDLLFLSGGCELYALSLSGVILCSFF